METTEFVFLCIFRMEGLVHDMVQYKSKIDQLKQEKCSLSVTYEVLSIIQHNGIITLYFRLLFNFFFV